MKEKQIKKIIEKKRAKRIKKKSIVRWLIPTAAAVLLLPVLTFAAVRAMGKASLQANLNENVMNADTEVLLVSDTEVGPEGDGYLYHDGKKYRRNENIYTILVIGVDTREDTLEAEEKMGSGAQADSVFLVVLDAENGKIDIIAIPRDTMTQISVYDKNGQYYDTVEEHLALQYAYGDGGTRSCELMEESVSKLMYGLPIHAYVALHMEAVPILNDAVGGVTVELQEDLSRINGNFPPEGMITLHGEDARFYIQYRDINSDYSALQRLGRQKQYMMAFAAQAISAMKEDLTLPVKIYQSLGSYMITDIRLDELTYLATAALECGLGEDNLHILAGEQVKGPVYEEFYIDEDALYDLILEVFYEPVEEP